MSEKKKTKKTSEIEELKQQAGEYLAGWQRAKADYENLLRESAKDKVDYIKYGNSSLIMELLPVLDNFNAAFNSVPDDAKNTAWLEGLFHIKRQLSDFLEAQGVKPIEAVGQPFDPEQHEAIDDDFDAEQDEDIILREIKSGYTLHGKVIQAAKVVVNKKQNNDN